MSGTMERNTNPEDMAGTSPVLRDTGGTLDDLYFAKLPSGCVKIGRSATPKKRLKGLQTACPERFEWTKIWPGRGGEEKIWHKAFELDRLNGEWFIWSAEMSAAIDAESCAEAYERRREGQEDCELADDNARLRRLLYAFVRNRAQIVSPKHQDLLDCLMDTATEVFHSRPPEWLLRADTAQFSE